MKQWKRLIYYLLLNILVSACTTVGVLVAWDQLHGPLPGGVLSLAQVRSSPVPSETPAVPAGTPVPAPTATPSYIVYTVKDGDQFSSIAATFGVDEQELIQLNGFTKDQPLGPGEGLLIPVTTTPSPAPEVVITGVIGAGDLDSERVVLRQQGAGDLLLAGWKLVDGNGDVYTFPALEIARDGFELEIYTKAGTDAANALYWGLSQPVWRQGETVILEDAQGNVRFKYQVP